jgi:esterase/lipase/1-acyl-sn-glycerol-3-phosphate acyltransferase
VIFEEGVNREGWKHEKKETMNRFAYRTTGLAIKTLSQFSKARIHLHGETHIPQGSLIFVINHFTRMETLFLPYHLYYLTGKKPVWSLGDADLFKGALGDYLKAVGVISTRSPDRDLLIVKSLLTGEASWIIYPEGLMVKNKKLVEKGRFMLSYAGGKHPPHTGAATLALRAEFYRQRLISLSETLPDEARRLMSLFQIEDIAPLKATRTVIVPVNITYYPMRSRENTLSRLAEFLVDHPSDRMMDETMTEGAMLLSGVDIDIRFGAAISIQDHLTASAIERDISAIRAFGFDDPISSRRALHKQALKIMQQYMTAIYSMTTVNPDHLFAAMLNKIPFKRIDAFELRRRVFLTITQELVASGSFMHQSLAENQIHLITDDNYNRFQDFIDFGVEKKFLAQKGTDLIKLSATLPRVLNFHRVRIDNPFSVMVNETEPLVKLQRSIRCLAWQPSFWIRRRITRILLEKALSDYTRDYDAFFIAGESKDKFVGQPILKKGRTRKLGIVLFHGYMAAPMELNSLAEYLAEKGWWVYVPRLKGHGTAPEDLATRTAEDWINSADEAVALMTTKCRKVVLGGFSMGAGLALEAAARICHPALSGVFAVCPPFRLQDFSSKFVPAVSMWNRFMTSVKREDVKKEFVENHPENPHINYLRNPVSGMRELDKLMKSTENRLDAIRLPAFLVQSDEDPVVDEKGTRKAFKLLGSERKCCLMIHSSRHGILLGAGATEVYRAIGAFISRLVKPD